MDRLGKLHQLRQGLGFASCAASWIDGNALASLPNFLRRNVQRLRSHGQSEGSWDDPSLSSRREGPRKHHSQHGQPHKIDMQTDCQPKHSASALSGVVLSKSVSCWGLQTDELKTLGPPRTFRALLPFAFARELPPCEALGAGSPGPVHVAQRAEGRGFRAECREASERAIPGSARCLAGLPALPSASMMVSNFTTFPTLFTAREIGSAPKLGSRSACAWLARLSSPLCRLFSRCLDPIELRELPGDLGRSLIRLQLSRR